MRRIVSTVRYSTSIMSWNRTTGPSNVESFWGAWRTIAGYEAIHMIRKGQACATVRWVTKVGLLHRFILGLFAATS